MIYLRSKLIKTAFIRCFKRKYSQKGLLDANKWISVVGLEVHAQIASVSKLFSGASTKFLSPVNTNVSLFDCAIPGTLPVLNKKCVEYAVLTALALNCKVNPVSMFDRKHYFYADMPAGYQITQQRSPLANDGYLEFQVFTPGYHKAPYKTKVKIKQLQLEQDSGKSLHDKDKSLVDLNRAGVPLMELVFDPDLSDGEEAAALVKELSLILERIGTCSCKMEEGALRVDANVSVHQKGTPLGVRTEIKNIGSVRGVANAVNYEINRQIKVKEKGGEIINETRAYDAANKITVPMRDKEQQQDYRYMPEPNLPPLHVAIGPVCQGCVNVDEIKNTIPELPEGTRNRLQSDCGLTTEQSIIIVNDDCLLDLFENGFKSRHIQGKVLADLLINDLTSVLYKANKKFTDLRVNGDYFAQIVELLHNETITRNVAKLIINETVNGNTNTPIKIVKDNKWMQINDHNELTKICQNALEENPNIVAQYKAGKVKVFKALLGIIVKKTEQRANMGKCSNILKKLLNQ